MTRDICCMCGEDTHICDAFHLKIGKYEDAYICVWCLDKELKSGTDFRVVRPLNKRDDEK